MPKRSPGLTEDEQARIIAAIRDELEAREWSQSDLARAAGIDRRNVNRFLGGEEPIGYKAAADMLKALSPRRDLVGGMIRHMLGKR